MDEINKPTKCTVQIAVREELDSGFMNIIESHKAEVLKKIYEKNKNGMCVDYTLRLKDVYDLFTMGKELGYWEKMIDDSKKN